MLGRDWQDAEAVVIAAEQYMATGDVAGPSSVHLVLEVHPPAGEPFRTSLKVGQMGFNLKNRRFRAPAVGERIPVKFEPKSKKVKVVVDEAHDARYLDKREKDQWQAMVDAPVGSAPVPGTIDITGATDPQQIGELIAQQLGGNASVTVQNVDIVGNDPLDQLERLGKLKEQGLLTDAEFAAQKAKLLGSS